MLIPLGAAAATPTPFAPEGLLLDLLAVSLTGVNVLSPVYNAAGELVDFAIDYLNPTAQRMAGLGERPGGTISGRFPDTFANGTFAFYRRVFETGQADRYDFNYQADGLGNYFHVAARRSEGWLLVSFTDTSDQSRTPVEEALRASQVAERQARAEAEQQRQRFQEVLRQLPAYVAVYQGPDHVYQFVNPPYQRLFPHRNFLGRPFREGTPEAVALGVVGVFDRVYQTGEPYSSSEMEGWFDFTGHGQPEQVFLNLYLHPLRNAQGDIDGVLDFSYDVTEQVRARQQFEQLNQELETRVQERTEELAAVNQELQVTNGELKTANQQLTRTNVDLDSFIYTASHDLSAPIANIEGLLLALREQLATLAIGSDNLIPQLLDMMQGAVERFQLTISHLTDISRLQQGQQELAEPVNLAAVVEAVRLDLLPLVAATATELRLDVDRQLHVLLAPQHLRSVVYNLLSNAIKYHHPERPPRVQLRATRGHNTLTISIQDNGLGLDEAQQGRLFGLFQRLHAHVEGSGVGLYIVKRLVENVGGSIAVQSQPGVGSTFTVTLPA